MPLDPPLAHLETGLKYDQFIAIGACCIGCGGTCGNPGCCDCYSFWVVLDHPVQVAVVSSLIHCYISLIFYYSCPPCVYISIFSPYYVVE